MSNNRPIWTGRWSYPEGWIISIGLLLLALLWQSLLGPMPHDRIPHPWVIVGLVALLLLAVLFTFLRERGVAPRVIRFLYSPAATLCSITQLMIVVLVAGFTTQIPPEMARGMGSFIHRMGATSVVHSYPFLVSYIYLLLVLLCITLRRIWHFRRPVRDIAFVLNHVGLAYFLAFALLSFSSIERYRMTVAEGETEWRGMTEHEEELVELPVAIELSDFRMEEYDPKLMLLRASGKVIKSDGEKGSPQEILLEGQPPMSGTLADWEVTVDEVLPYAAPVMNGDDLRYVEWHSEGATSAAHVTAMRSGEQPRSGWVSNGSYLIPYRGLTLLEDSLTLVMPEREPRQYYSDVTYYTQWGESGEATISVNSPLVLGSWYIYQTSYDLRKGRWSEVSQLELVRDPYIVHIYIGLVMLLLGALLLIFTPPTRQ